MAKKGKFVIAAILVVVSLVTAALIAAYSYNQSAYTPTKLSLANQYNSIESEGQSQPSPNYMVVHSPDSSPIANSSRSGNSNNAVSGMNLVPSLFEYKFDVPSNEIFPNNTTKNKVVTLQNETEYYLPTLSAKVLGQHIDATNVTIFVRPSGIDSENIRLDFYIHAQKAHLSGADDEKSILNKTYDGLELKTIYGIYNKPSDRITVHVPYAAALSLVTQ